VEKVPTVIIEQLPSEDEALSIRRGSGLWQRSLRRLNLQCDGLASEGVGHRRDEGWFLDIVHVVREGPTIFKLPLGENVIGEKNGRQQWASRNIQNM
jgi:hypothetical protein